MKIKPLIFMLAGAAVALFYALESFLFFKANGFAPALFLKILICVVGAIFFWRNFKALRGGNSANA